MDTLKPGMKHSLKWEVTEDLCTSRGNYKVFSTPSMTRFVEMASHYLIAQHLKPGQGQVGVVVNIRHLAPTPCGKEVRAEVELLEIDRRMVRLKIEVYDEVEKVGEAIHDRFVVDLDKSEAKLKAKCG